MGLAPKHLCHLPVVLLNTLRYTAAADLLRGGFGRNGGTQQAGFSLSSLFHHLHQHVGLNFIVGWSTGCCVAFCNAFCNDLPVKTPMTAVPIPFTLSAIAGQGIAVCRGILSPASQQQKEV